MPMKTLRFNVNFIERHFERLRKIGALSSNRPNEILNENKFCNILHIRTLNLLFEI